MKKALTFALITVMAFFLISCGADVPAETTAHVHSYASEVTKNATCTEDGVTTFTCSCGENYTEVIEAMGHSWGEWAEKTAASFVADGVEAMACANCGEEQTRALDQKPLKVLFIGNSFAVDTTDHAPRMAKELGVKEMKFGVLYIGGCSINKHYANMLGKKADYTYYHSTGGAWTTTEGYSIQRAIEEDDWDYICIQHGTGDGSRYTQSTSYANLGRLVKLVKQAAGDRAIIAFNMAWVMEPDSTHKEMQSYGGDQLKMYENLTATTQSSVATVEGIDIVIPTGTTVQNARTVVKRLLTRDKFHLSKDLGRYMAAMTMLEAMCGIETDGLTWRASGVSAADLEIAKKAVNSAIAEPYKITQQ